MREFSTPKGADVPTVGNLTDDVIASAEEHPNHVVLRYLDDSGNGRDLNAEDFANQVRELSAGLVDAGLERGDRMVIMAGIRHEWTLVDYAIWFAGLVSVPVFETASDEQIAWILNDSGAHAAITGSAGDAERLRILSEDQDTPLAHTWHMDDDGLDELRNFAPEVSGAAAATLEKRRTAATPLDLATIIYTSGTTGPPKGCMLTHGNLMTQVRVSAAQLPELFAPTDARTLMFLPLAHVFARVLQIGCVHARVTMGYVDHIGALPAALASFSPTFLLGVPRVFENLYNTAEQRATADGRQTAFQRATEAAIVYSKAREAGDVPMRLKASHRLYERRFYAELRSAFGGRCQHAISGGAPLGSRLAHFYAGIGIDVLAGYGLTETTAAVTANTPTASKIGTVGRPLPGTAVRVGDGGELLVRGPQVFAGYYEDEQRTREALDSTGWLRTGDIGEIDDEGFVRITGRQNEIIVTAGGKKVAPTALEDRVRASSVVSHCLVVGDAQPFIGALITLDLEGARELVDAESAPNKRARRPIRRQRSAPGALTRRELAQHPVVLNAVSAAVDRANRTVSRAESIRDFRVLTTEWTEESGQLTPSLKLRRSVVLAENHDAIREIYRTSGERP